MGLGTHRSIAIPVGSNMLKALFKQALVTFEVSILAAVTVVLFLFWLIVTSVLLLLYCLSFIVCPSREYYPSRRGSVSQFRGSGNPEE